jgi:hypothetical protein
MLLQPGASPTTSTEGKTDGANNADTHDPSTPSSNSPLHKSPNKRGPIDLDEEEPDNENILPPFKKGRGTQEVVVNILQIQCVTCGHKNNAARGQCWYCHADPRIMAQSTPAPTSLSQPLLPMPTAATLAAPLLPTPLNPGSTPSPTAVSTTSTSSALSHQSFLSKSTYLPLPAEAVEALKAGTFKETYHYMPRRITYSNMVVKEKISIEVTDGKVVAQSNAVTRKITSFQDLELAHRAGIIAELYKMNDVHRIAQYHLLWDAVRELKTRFQYPDDLIMEYYEMNRLQYPGVTDSVGEKHEDILLRVQTEMQARLIRAAANSNALRSPSSSLSSSSTPSSTSGRGRGTRVCIPYNDLTCTSDPCPRGLPHICCRCGENHAANSGDCALPDPRLQPGYVARGKRGGGKSQNVNKNKN